MTKKWSPARVLAAALLLPLWSCGDDIDVIRGGGNPGGGGTSPTTPSEPAPGLLDYELGPEVIEFTHVVGESPCPQRVGEIRVKNTSKVPQVYELRENLPQAKPLVIQPRVRTAKLGEVVTFTLFFDCSQQFSFTKVLTFDVQDEKGKADFSTVTIIGTVRF